MRARSAGAIRRAVSTVAAGRSRRVCLFTGIVLCACIAGAASAQLTPAGTVREDAVWTGEITIKGDVRIVGATVRVEAGSTIRFDARRGTSPGPVIQLDVAPAYADRPGRYARLVLAGTAERPIVVETPSGQSPGAIASRPASACSLVAGHVVFRRLGTATSKGRRTPALLVRSSGAESDLWLRNCRFEECGPVAGEFFGPDASAEITGCHFADTVGDVALLLSGSGTGIKVVEANSADASFRIDCPQVLLRENVLIGERAAISILGAEAGAITVAGNYVHCTTRLDDGRYAFQCEGPDVVLADNVLIGGTYVVSTAPRVVTGNVLVGVGGLEARFDHPDLQVKGLKRPTSTHQLIRDLVPDAVVTDNLLLGPAYASVATGALAARPRIVGNLFDGWGQARRALHLNLLARKTVDATFERNVVVRYTASPVFDEARAQNGLSAAGSSLFAEVGEPLYENIAGIADRAPGDGRFAAFGELRLQSPLATRAADPVVTDEQLRKGQMKVSDACAKWFAAYKALAGSPLALGTTVGPRALTSPDP